MTYFVGFHEDAKKQLLELDFSIRQRLIKRIARMREEPYGRHLKHGLPYFVEEADQYRIVYTCDEKKKEKIIYFVGLHKDYEKWCKAFR